MTHLIQFSGLPGTGKTTLGRRVASHFEYAYFSKDIFEARLYNDGLTDGHSIHSYHLMFDVTELHLKMRMSVVLDAVFPLAGFRDEVRAVAQRNHAQLRVIHTYCSDEALLQERLREREITVPWTPVDWTEVQRIQSYYEPWPPDAALFLDAADPLEANFAKLLAYVEMQRP